MIILNLKSINKYPILLNRKPEEIKCLTWEKVNRQYGRGHTNILSVIDLLLTPPASSAEVERGFSQLKLLKTDMRSKLKESHLNDLMSIKLLSAPVPEFDPAEAIQLWNTSGRSQARRPYFKETNKPGGKASGAVHAQAVNSRPHVQAVPVVTEQTAVELADGDVSGAEAVEVESASKDDGSEARPVEPLSRGDSCEESEENVGAEENENRDVVDTACDSDGYDSGVDNASDFDSDVEERQVESLINKYS